jgi:hypothetical protein
VTATTTDNDGDTAKASVDLSGLVAFEDDGPVVTTVAEHAQTLRVDETVRGTGDEDSASSWATAKGSVLGYDTANAAAMFTSDAGSDGGTTAYALTAANGVALAAGGVASGVYDAVTNNQIYLFVESGEVVGRVGGASAANASGNVAFVLHLDGSTIELAQYRAVEHNDPADAAETGLSSVLLGSGVLYVTATTTDNDGDTAKASVDLSGLVAFEDDGPAIAFNNLVVVSQGSATSVAGILDFGTDGTTLNSDDVEVTWVGGRISGYELFQSADGSWYAKTSASDLDSSALFKIDLNESGGYTFTAIKLAATTTNTIDLDTAFRAGTVTDLQGDTLGSASFDGVYQVFMDNPSGSPYDITATAFDSSGRAKMSWQNTTLGVGGDDTLQSQFGDTFRLDFVNTSGLQANLGAVTLQLNSYGGSDVFEIKVSYTDSSNTLQYHTYTSYQSKGNLPASDTSTTGLTVTYDVYGQDDVVTLDLSKLVGFKELSAIEVYPTNGVLKIVDFDIQTITRETASDYRFNFNAVAVDGDGDSASTDFAVTVLAGTDSADILSGTRANETLSGAGGNDEIYGLAGDDVLYGGAGNDTINGGAGNDTINGGAGDDTLTGGLGADVFKWNLGDAGNDVIKDFNKGSGTFNALEGDKLDLRDLLPDSVTTDNLSSYLQITEASGSVTVKFTAAGLGNFTAPTQSITLENVTLANLGLNSSDSLLTKLTKLQGGDPSL